MKDLSKWTPRPFPVRAPLEGQFVRLEPLDIERHGEGLFLASTVPDASRRFRYMWEHPPASREEYRHWLQKSASSQDPMFFVVVDKSSGVIGGRQSFLRVDAAHGVAEIGHIYWGPLVAGTRLATEAFYLFAQHLFDQLGYRRLEWKCDADNAHSRRAANRFGFRFEGIFRQNMVIKGRNRDTAWYAIVDEEWPRVRKALENWLRPANFDADGKQLMKLERTNGDAAEDGLMKQNGLTQ